MRKRNCGLAKNRRRCQTPLWCLTPLLLASGCATPQYAVRQTPVPDESAAAIQIERSISAVQANDFEQQQARLIGAHEVLYGLPIQSIVDRLSRVTERPGLSYRAYLYVAQDPNAAALADGRIYLSTGMLSYLAERPPRLQQEAGRGGGRQDELAFVLAHELAHTVAQHLVKRYRMLQQQQLLMALVAAGASTASRNASSDVQQAGRLALDVASMLRNVANSGYSQEHESEADQLGIRYVIRAGWKAPAALDLLKDFERFDTAGPFLRTHPHPAQRRADLQRYLKETGALGGRPSPAAAPMAGATHARRVKALRDAQALYPRGSVSWQNLQRQMDALGQ